VKPHDLKPAEGAVKRRKRVGRGDASGKGKTAGRGTKGTRARGEVPLFFEGGQMPLVRRVPKLKGFTPPNRKVFGAVNVSELEQLSGSDIGPDELRSAGLVHKRDKLIKVLGHGDLSRAVNVTAHAFSESARSKIEAAGGSITVLQSGPEKRGPGAPLHKRRSGAAK
jgi:large subunit ribosomal protein L15